MDIRVVKIVVLSLLPSLILIGVVVGVSVGRSAREELPPPIQTTTRPLIYCTDGYSISMVVSVCMYVKTSMYISEHVEVRCNTEQWHKFTLMLDAIEYTMGINRVDDAIWIALNKTETIKFCEKKECITLTLEQWFQLRQLTDKINSALGVKNDTAEQP